MSGQVAAPTLQWTARCGVGREGTRGTVNNAFLDYYRCPESFADLELRSGRVSGTGFFAFGSAIGYGRLRGPRPARYVSGALPEVGNGVAPDRGRALELAFDISEVLTNLREERYEWREGVGYLERVFGSEAARDSYYFFRPILPVVVRKHFQKA